MNTMTQTIVRKAQLASAVLMAIALMVLVSPAFVKAAGDGGDSYDYFVPDYDSSSSYDYFVPDTVSGYSYDYFVPDTNYASSYGSSGYYGSSFVGSGYVTGSGYVGRSYIGTPSYSTPVYPTPAPVMPSVSNTCTAVNSCNSITTIDDHSVVNANTIVSNPAPVINNVITNPPVYNAPVCNYCSCNSAYCYHAPIAYNDTPYVTLSAVPYTGLDLGPWGTAAYWGFLMLWALVAAYLVVVKKVHQRIAVGIRNFFLGYPHEKVAVAEHSNSTLGFSQADLSVIADQLANILGGNTAKVATATPVTGWTDKTDDFVLSQINRHTR